MKFREAAGIGIADGVGSALMVGVVLALLVLGPLCLEYSLEYWAAFFDRPVDLPLWHPLTLLSGVILSEIMVPVALVTWLLSWVLA